ncbi:sulfate permease [Georgenia sp. EYE_87]|uniref:sulfate permease n=1 Tax=Georgenia sp. EYE_87 TaxID=2853448 RepID=UPI0020053331|nr:sulfate permease [Georgenia sp. EYE_87]MCK6209271.1 sulfate permease [Georgenia sp. EYE_87]
MAPPAGPETGLHLLRRYRRAWWRGDVVAGVTVTAYLVPQVMAYGALAGLPPAVGLWTILPSLALYAVLGSSRHLSVGPESTTALMVALVVGPLADGDPARYATLAAALALLVGVLALLARLARLGVVSDVVSRPVLIGYMAGVAALMISGQLEKVTGVSVPDGTFAEQVLAFLRGLGEVDPATTALAAVTLLALLLLKHFVPRAPGPILVVLAATAAVALAGARAGDVAVVGRIPAAVPTPGLPAVDLADLGSLVPAALGVLIVGFTDNVLTARAFASKGGYRIDPDQELLALGAVNVAAGLVHGFPVSSSGSRTAIGVASGARTQMYSLVAVVTVLAVLLLGRPLLAQFPMAALGALIVFAALQLIDVPGFRKLASFRRAELALAVATLAAVVILGILPGVLLAVALSFVEMLLRVGRPHDAVLGQVPGLAGMHDVDDYPEATTIPGLVVYRYDSPLFFANAEDFRRRALRAVEDQTDRVRWFVLNAEANVEVDLTALDALEALRAELTDRGVVVAMARVKQDLFAELEAYGLVEALGRDRFYATLPTAVAAYREWARSSS